jgi:hypothetical protein
LGPISTEFGVILCRSQRQCMPWRVWLICHPCLNTGGTVVLSPMRRYKWFGCCHDRGITSCAYHCTLTAGDITMPEYVVLLILTPLLRDHFDCDSRCLWSQFVVLHKLSDGIYDVMSWQMSSSTINTGIGTLFFVLRCVYRCGWGIPMCVWWISLDAYGHGILLVLKMWRIGLRCTCPLYMLLTAYILFDWQNN